MKKLICTLFLLSCCIAFLTAQDKLPGITCIIEGVVVDRPESSSLLLLGDGEDPRINGTSIPIEEGKFRYVLLVDHHEMYSLNFSDELQQGSWRPVPFFAENDTVRFTLFPQDRYDENTVDGGILNREYAGILRQRENAADITRLEQERQLLDESNRLYSPEVYGLIQILRTTSDEEERQRASETFAKLREANQHYSPEGADCHRRMAEALQQRREWEVEYAGGHISIPSYYLLIGKARQKDMFFPLDHTSAYDLYNRVYAEAYPDHPYTEEFQKIILSQSQIRPGGKYIDFTAPDFEGNRISLSSRIEGKVALIDLWASWCGPCRRMSKSLIPVYEKYKDRGFVIVGVAREKNAESGILAAQRDGYPWLNLLEIQDAASIWHLYGVGNGGGATFLVDRDGTILAVHPQVEEVEKILEEKL